MRQGRYADAADGMLNSAWSTQVGARATRLADMMAKGA
jgi:lysozyme